ncbi:MAG TPA: glycosyltransferase family 4 protein [Piscinibacter sp.]|nr:glycosyltransferase family 4 protein [Piscinibacter sp.]
MRIGLFIPNLRAGGAERVACLLSEAWRRAGHDVVLVTFEAPRERDFQPPDGVQRLVLGGEHETRGWASVMKNLRRVRDIRRTLRAQRLDAAVSFLMETNVCLALAGIGMRTVCVGSERTYPPAMPCGAVRETLRRHAYAALDCVVVASAGTAAWAHRATRARAVRVISNPMHWPLPRRDCDLTPARCLAPGHRLLLSVGRLDAVKQFDHLLRAFARLASDRPLWQLAIVGEGPERVALEAQARALGLADRVLLPGLSADVAAWYAAADLYSLTSAAEGFPNALLEALASGVPAVSYDCLTGPSDLVVPGLNGMLVPPNDEAALTQALATLMDDAALRDRMRGASRALREAHAPERIGAQWLAALQACGAPA